MAIAAREVPRIGVVGEAIGSVKTRRHHDRRRLEDRVFRLRTGYAWSQAPKSRTVRMISNVEVFRTAQATARMVRSNLLISEFRPDGVRFLSGWCAHRFVEREGLWQIAVRQVNLIDCDQNLRNPSIVI